LARAGENENEDGDIVATEEVHRVHVDFWDIFEPTGVCIAG